MKYVRKGALVLPDHLSGKGWNDPRSDKLWALRLEYFVARERLRVKEDWPIDENRMVPLVPDDAPLAFVCLETEIPMNGMKDMPEKANSFWVMLADIIEK